MPSALPRVVRFTPLILAVALVAACAPSKATDDPAKPAARASASAAMAPLLAAPQVGDLYAAEVTHFSGADFTSEDSGESTETAYGVMKVVGVTPDRITLFTENDLSEKPQSARNDLYTLWQVSWDKNERVSIRRDKLTALVQDGKILEVRRPSSPPKATPPDPTLDPILANPKVGDIIAAELTYFSGATYETPRTYGLMKVVAVSPDRLTAFTETGGWPKPQGARNDLGTMEGIEWAEDEQISIPRDQLAALIHDDKILDVRRP